MPLSTYTNRMFVGRVEAAANTTFGDVLATQGDFAQKPSSVIDVLDPARLDPITESTKNVSHRAISKANGLIFYFAGGDANNDAFTWKVYAWRNENGPAEIVADGTGILGSQAVVVWPHNPGVPVSDRFWSDTLVVSNSYWIKRVQASTIGSNSVAKLWFDTSGYRYFYVEVPISAGVMASYIAYW